MRILPNQAPASPVSSRPASVLSAALTRTPAFRALFPQLRLPPRESMPAAPSRGPHQGEGGVDRFAKPMGRGIPVRINALAPQPQPTPLRLKPWLGSPLRPWCGTGQKPWLKLPHLFMPFVRLGAHVACRVLQEGGTRGKGIPIRLS